MFRTLINIATCLVIMLFSAAPAFAGDSADDIRQRIGAGDPVAGKEKSAMCRLWQKIKTSETPKCPSQNFIL